VTPKNFGIWSNISPKLLELETSNLVHGFVWRMTCRRTKISPKSGRGLGHVTSTIFGSTVGYPSHSLASCFTFGYKFFSSVLLCFSTQNFVKIGSRLTEIWQCSDFKNNGRPPSWIWSQRFRLIYRYFGRILRLRSKFRTNLTIRC